jgi:hypothetical protein
MAKRPVDFIDPTTGEIQQGHIVWSETNPNNLTKRKFFMVFQDAMIMLAKDRELTPQAFRVMMYLFGSLDFDNWIHITQKEIGEKLKMDKSDVSRAFSILKRKQIIVLSPYKGVPCYKINDFYAWKGSVSSIKKEKEERKDKPKLTVVK